MDREQIAKEIAKKMLRSPKGIVKSASDIADWHIAEIEKAKERAKISLLKEIDPWIEKDPEFPPDVPKYVMPNPSNLKWFIDQKLKESEG